MSTEHDDTTTTDAQATTDSPADTAPAADAADDPSPNWLPDDIERKLRAFFVAGLALLALIALLRFYFAASATIDELIAPAYRSLFQALFNLVILLLAGAGILWQARELR